MLIPMYSILGCHKHFLISTFSVWNSSVDSAICDRMAITSSSVIVGYFVWSVQGDKVILTLQHTLNAYL